MRQTLSASKGGGVVQGRQRGAKLPGGVSVRMLEAREKRAKAIELRKAGASYEEIARTVGYANGTSARRATLKAIEQLAVEPTVQALLLELQRLDEYQKRCTVALRQNNDLSQVDRLMRITQMRLTLMGVTPEVVREIADRAEQPKNGGAALTNNGIIVIQGTESDFLKGMLEATGADPALAEQYLKGSKAQAKNKKEKVVRVRRRRKAVKVKSKRIAEVLPTPSSTVDGGQDTSSVYPHMHSDTHVLREQDINGIIDAEIVNEL